MHDQATFFDREIKTKGKAADHRTTERRESNRRGFGKGAQLIEHSLDCFEEAISESRAAIFEALECALQIGIRAEENDRFRRQPLRFRRIESRTSGQGLPSSGFCR